MNTQTLVDENPLQRFYEFDWAQDYKYQVCTVATSITTIVPHTRSEYLLGVLELLEVKL